LQIFNSGKTDYASLAMLLKDGQIFCYPTETLYGLGCTVDNKLGLERIYKIKSREKEKKFSILFKDLEMIREFCEIGKIEEDLIMNFTPGPLSILLRTRNENLANKLLIGLNGKISCRVSSHPFVAGLFKSLNIPIVSTSANISGSKNIFSFKTIYNTFHNLVDIIVDGGDINESMGSTIIEMDKNDMKLIREGDIKEKEITVFLNGRN